MKYLLSYCVIALGLPAMAQSDTTASNNLTLSGYIETYYAYDLNQPANQQRPAFVYSYNRHNEVNLNLGYIKAAYANEKLRGNLALMAGTYTNANLAAEPGTLKNIFEANVGVKISRQRNLWVDAGIFAAHIGFESARGKDCWTLTRSILADNSPYYETGVKISYTSNNAQWLLSGLLLNGWQRMQRQPGNNSPAFGHQITYTPNSNLLVNSSSFIGSDTPDSTKRMRYFHNFYLQWQATPRMGIIVGFDIGGQQAAPNSKQLHTWYAPIVMLRYNHQQHWFITGRAEYYADPHQVIISVAPNNKVRLFGYSVNFDYPVTNNLLWRIEARSMHNASAIFTRKQTPVSANALLTTALALSF